MHHEENEDEALFVLFYYFVHNKRCTCYTSAL